MTFINHPKIKINKFISKSEIVLEIFENSISIDFKSLINETINC